MKYLGLISAAVFIWSALIFDLGYYVGRTSTPTLSAVDALSAISAPACDASFAGALEFRPETRR